MSKTKHTNALIHESSPYLLQHAHNPVHWLPWGEAALQKAKAENKLILISIGYSACHWCHVMEHESFEDEGVAEIMNQHYVCIKIDREERPDIDHIYMTAVQLISGQGGWPLNCITLPDQRPIYGGTYFRKEEWKKLLLTLAGYFQEKPADAEAYADKLMKGIHQAEKIVNIQQEQAFTKTDLHTIVEPWKRLLDFTDGGHNRAPKFPLPNNFLFFLRYAHLMKDEAITVSVRLTLEKMAYGGIYDQIGGGFARYSVDGHWLVPHFEKMLYDNAQLVSLYAEAYQCFKDPLYEQIIDQTIGFVHRELTNEYGGFYSALDADSEGVEGKFYTWKMEDLKNFFNEQELNILSAYYNVSTSGNWEEEHTNILHRRLDDGPVADSLGLSVEALQECMELINEKLFMIREQRIRPGLDDKTLTSWNALMIEALVKAYRVFDKAVYLEMAEKAALFLWNTLFVNGQLYRSYKNEKVSIPAFLDDYAFLIQAFTALYQATFEEHWLDKASTLTTIVLRDFSDAETEMFFYSSSTQLIARKHEVMDNVIPAANSAMANALFELGMITDTTEWKDRALKMLVNVQPAMAKYGSAYSNWAILLLNQVASLNEVVLTGDSLALRKALDKHYFPQKVLLGTKGEQSKLSLLKGKSVQENKIYICEQGACRLPVSTVAEALAQLSLLH